MPQSKSKLIILPPGGGRSYLMGRIVAVFKADQSETDNRYSISEWWLEANTKGPGIHSHDEDDLFFVIEGTMSIHIDGTWTDMPKGSFVLVPGGIKHDFENRSNARAGVFNLSFPGGFEENMPDLVDWYKENPAGDAR